MYKRQLFGAAFVTQILAIVGIAADINGMTWLYGVLLVGIFTDFFTVVLDGLALDTAYAEYRTGSANATAAFTLAGSIKEDFARIFAVEALSYAILSLNFTKWYQSQKNATKEKSADAGAADKEALFSLIRF